MQKLKLTVLSLILYSGCVSIDGEYSMSPVDLSVHECQLWSDKDAKAIISSGQIYIESE